jgi:hypothetical protein
MNGSQHRPHREPAAGTVLCGKGSAWQHAKSDEMAVATHDLVGWRYLGNLLPGFSPEMISAPGILCGMPPARCTGQYDFRIPIGDPNGGCGPYLFPLGPTVPPQPEFTTYATGTVDLSQCRKTFYKNVIAARNWHVRVLQ